MPTASDGRLAEWRIQILLCWRLFRQLPALLLFLWRMPIFTRDIFDTPTARAEWERIWRRAARGIYSEEEITESFRELWARSS
jgi:hypothetical protein